MWVTVVSKKGPSLEDSENSLKHQYCVKRDHGGNLVSRLVRVWFVLIVWVRVWFVVRKQVYSLKWVVRKCDLWVLVSWAVVVWFL